VITALLFLALTTPDPLITPGVLCTPFSVGFDGYAYSQAIPHCKRHVTATMRRTVLARYGIPWARRGTVEIDHLIPLCLGGSNDLGNLWAEPLRSAERKDAVEKRLCSGLRAGKITQAAAVEQIREWK
jgi:hypothetical protein